MRTRLQSQAAAPDRSPPRAPGVGARGLARLAALGLAAGALLCGPAGCGDDVKRTNKRGQGPPAQAANLKDVGKPSAELIDEKSAPREGAPRKRKRKKGAAVDLPLPKPDEFSERDFVESEQESRDPFRNLLEKEPTKAAPVEVIQPGDTVFLKDYPLAELKVTGIVGGARRFAMVLDPRTGRTTILQKRDRIGKERALIFEVNRDHLLLLVPRLRPNKDDPYERKAVYVDEQRKIVDIGSDALRPDESGIRYSTPRRRTLAGARPKEP